MTVTKEPELILKMLCQPHPYNKYSGCGQGQTHRQKVHCLHQQEERDLKYIPWTQPLLTEGMTIPALLIQHFTAASQYSYSPTQMTFFPFNSLLEAKFVGKVSCLKNIWAYVKYISPGTDNCLGLEGMGGMHTE